MEHAFNCSERLWISQVDFIGQKEIEFLQRWKTYLVPTRQILYNENENTRETEIVVDQEPQPSTSRGTSTRRSKNKNTNKKTTTTNSNEDQIHRLKKRIEKLGDDFFAIPETIKKRKRKELAKKKANKKSRANNNNDNDTNSDDSDDEEEEEENNDALNNNEQQDNKQGEKEKEEELYFWKGSDGCVEDQYGHQLNLNEVSSSDDDDSDDDNGSSSSSEGEDYFEQEGDKKSVDLEETARQWIRGLGPLDKIHDILFKEDNKNNTNNTQEETQNFTNDTNENNSIINIISNNTNQNSNDDDDDEELQTIFVDLTTTTTQNQNDDTTTTQNPVTELILVGPSNNNNNVNNSTEIEMEIDDVANDNNNRQNETDIEDEDLTMPENEQDENTTNNNNAENNNVNDMQVAVSQDKNSEEEYFENLQRKRWENKQEKERKDVKRRNQLQQLFGFDDKELDFMISQSQFTFDEIKRMPFVDEPILKNGLMPILAPPIPRSVLKTSQALAVYVNFSSNPGEFQWKCKSANEQMADCVNDDLRFRKRMEAKKKFYESTDHEEFVDEKDVVFTVLFYHTSSGSGSHAKVKEPEMAVTVNILGSQTLMDLRKVFYCKHDHIGKEIEGNPLQDSEEPIISKDACLRAMQKNMDEPCGMFVGSTMFRNESSIENHDYAAELLKWSEGLGIFRKKLVGPFEAGEMENTKLIDLRFKHGFPYLFIHQGNCEHLMVIEKVRLVHPTEFLLKNDFPKIVKSNFRTVYCQVDNTRIARFAIRNSKWFPQDPMLICPECLELCFKGNERVDNFKLYPFLQISSLF